MIDLKQQPTPINLVDWVSLYDTEIRGNYGIEFLTAATERTLRIPNAEQYHLPPDVEGKDLDETIEELVRSNIIGINEKRIRERIRGRKKGIKKVWEQGKKPWAIKVIDELRETENPEFKLDLLEPRLYNGTKTTGNSIPYAVDILPNLVYLYTSVLISGSSSDNKHNHKGNASIWPSKRLPENLLKQKIQGVYTEDRECEGAGIKRQYSNLLQLLGMPQGRISELDYEKLGLGFIENLTAWVEEKRLSKEDNEHAMNCLYRFIEAFIDHKYMKYHRNIHTNGKKYDGEAPQITMPGFKNKRTRDNFRNLFLRAWNLVNPDIPISHPKLYLRVEYHDKLEARFPVPKAA